MYPTPTGGGRFNCSCFLISDPYLARQPGKKVFDTTLEI
jgi:hypothetical protein